MTQGLVFIVLPDFIYCLFKHCWSRDHLEPLGNEIWLIDVMLHWFDLVLLLSIHCSLSQLCMIKNSTHDWFFYVLPVSVVPNNINHTSTAMVSTPQIPQFSKPRQSQTGLQIRAIIFFSFYMSKMRRSSSCFPGTFLCHVYLAPHLSHNFLCECSSGQA